MPNALKNVTKSTNQFVNNFHKISIKIRIDSKLIAMIFTKFMHTFLFPFDLSVFFLNLITKFIRLSTLFFDLNHILYISFLLIVFLFRIFFVFVCHVWWHVVPCSLKFQFHYTNNLIGYALTFGVFISLLVIRFSCRSCTFSFTLFYYIFFFCWLVNFLQQTQVNFRLISVFTLFFQSLNQQNKTINTNNERKIKNGIVLIHFVLVIYFFLFLLYLSCDFTSIHFGLVCVLNMIFLSFLKKRHWIQ